MQLAMRGGCFRVGFRNCLTFQHNGFTLMVDCGAGISPRYALEQGPNFRAIDPDNLRVILTHGHNDHIVGAIKLYDFFPRDFLNFHGSPFTLGRMMKLMEKDRESLWPWQLNAVEPFDTEWLGNNNCRISSFPVEHSIMDPRGWSIQMDGKHIVHLGDIKHLPAESLDYIRRQGIVDYLFLDSTGALDKGYAPDESEFNKLIEPMIANSNKAHRLVIAGFSTNIPRWMQVIALAAKYGKLSSLPEIILVRRSLLAKTPAIAVGIRLLPAFLTAILF
jgi:mRNA degradation ribonuclease J1/J2